MATLLQTQQLGAIQGKSSDGVTQYLGIKYATLKNRLADAVLYERNSDGVLDATNDG
jgi:carboxylesterase type B